MMLAGCARSVAPVLWLGGYPMDREHYRPLVQAHAPRRKVASVRIVLACLLAAGLTLPTLATSDMAWAGERGKKRRDKFDFDDPEDAGSTTPGGTRKRDGDRRRSGRSAEDQILEELGRLKSWPNKAGTRAAESLYLRGPSVIPHLVRVLDDAETRLKNFPLQPGAAWVLGKVGEEVHVQVILRAAARRPNASKAEAFFRSAYGLSAKETKRWLIGFLALANRPVFRKSAIDFLESRVTPMDQPRILDLLESTQAPVRAAGLSLMKPSGVPDADDRLIQALGDLSPDVAYKAARELAEDKDPRLHVRLNRLAREGGPRERAYACIALVERARATQSDPFEDATIATMSGRRGLLHPEKRNRAAAAISLAYGAMDTTDPAIGALLDQTVVEVLIDAVSGKHYRDFSSLSPNVFAALRRLSGEDLPETAVDWARWWRNSRATFQARKPLRELAAADMARSYVEFDVVEASGVRRVVSFVPEEGETRKDGFFVRTKAFRQLVEFLEGMGIFEARPPRAMARGQRVTATLGVLNQRRQLTVAKRLPNGHVNPDYERLRLRVESLIDTNLWQRYRDAEKWADAKTWWTRNEPLIANATPEERDSMLQAAIVHAYDDLPSDADRADALMRLRRIEQRLSDNEAVALAEHLAASPAFGASEADALRWLLDQNHQRARLALMTGLAKRPEPMARAILSELFTDAGLDGVREGFRDTRPEIREAAAESARLIIERGRARNWTADEQEAVELKLRPGLEVLAGDKEPRVAVKALMALAFLGDADTVDRLKKLYNAGSTGTRLDVVRAFGYLPGSVAHPFLTKVLADSRGERDGTMRAASLEAMARTNHPNSARMLMFYLLNDRDRFVQDTAAKMLAKDRSSEARVKVIEQLARAPRDPVRRARLVRVLGQFEGDGVSTHLMRFLGDPDRFVKAEAAVGAARHNLAEAVPYLIEALRATDGRVRDEAVQALRIVTSKTFDTRGYSALAERYDAWRKDHREGTHESWFAEALAARGYDAARLKRYARGDRDPEAVPVFLRALRDDDMILRRNADRALERTRGTRGGIERVDLQTTPLEATQIAEKWATWFDRARRAPATR